MVFNQGLVGPKAKPKGAADGQLVNILALGHISNALHSTIMLADYRISALVSKGMKKIQVARSGN